MVVIAATLIYLPDLDDPLFQRHIALTLFLKPVDYISCDYDTPRNDCTGCCGR